MYTFYCNSLCMCMSMCVQKRDRVAIRVIILVLFWESREGKQTIRTINLTAKELLYKLNGNWHKIMTKILFDNCICSMKRQFYLGDNNGHFLVNVLIFSWYDKKTSNMKENSHQSKK